MAMDTIEAIVDRLCHQSRVDWLNPYDYFQWPESVTRKAWFMSPELISIYGTGMYDSLSEAERQTLSFNEAVNFFSLNIHGEKSLCQGLAQRVYRGDTITISPYLHHFLDEENKHMVYFGNFCLRYAGKVYADRKVALPREYEPGEEDFLFFARVLIFEEIVDVYNVKMAIDKRLEPTARTINHLHHRDEARHLVFGRALVAELFRHWAPQWSGKTLQNIREYLTGYLLSTWKEYYNVDVYEDAGFADPYEIHQDAFNHDLCRAHRQKISKGCMDYLINTGILEEEPSL